MSRKMVRVPRLLVLAATGVLFLLASACSSGPASKSQESSTSPTHAGASLAKSSAAPRPTLECYADRTRNVPAPFHLS
jgi:hypothetical protein